MDDAVEGAAQREDRIGLGWSPVAAGGDPCRPLPNVLTHTCDKLRAGNRLHQGARLWPMQGEAVLLDNIEIQQVVSPSFDHMERLAWADHGHCVRLRLEGAQAGKRP